MDTGPSSTPSAMTAAAMEVLLSAAVKSPRVRALEPVLGGTRNASYRVELEDNDQPLFIRLYSGNVTGVLKERTVSLLLASSAAYVPRLLYVAEDNPVTGQPYSVSQWVEGQHLGSVISRLSEKDLADLGCSVGNVLGQIHQAMSFDRFGFLDERLAVAQKRAFGGFELLSHLHTCLVLRRGGDRFGSELVRSLLDFVLEEGYRLDLWTGRPTLVHGDFNAWNILVQPSVRGWKVSGVVDWECALSGTPFFDLGAVLRSPLQSNGAFSVGIERGYHAAGGSLPNDWRIISDLTNLFTWGTLITGPIVAPALIAAVRTSVTRLLARPGCRRSS